MAREIIISTKDATPPDLSEMAVRRPRVNPELILGIISPILILALWEGLVRAGRLNALFFPPPTVVFQTMYRMTLSGDLPAEVGVSLRRVLYGFVLGAAPAVVIGLSLGWAGRGRGASRPSRGLPCPGACPSSSPACGWVSAWPCCWWWRRSSWRRARAWGRWSGWAGRRCRPGG